MVAVSVVVVSSCCCIISPPPTLLHGRILMNLWQVSSVRGGAVHGNLLCNLFLAWRCPRGTSPAVCSD